MLFLSMWLVKVKHYLLYHQEFALIMSITTRATATLVLLDLIATLKSRIVPVIPVTQMWNALKTATQFHVVRVHLVSVAMERTVKVSVRE